MFDLDSTIPRREIPTTNRMTAQCWPSLLGMPLRVANITKATHKAYIFSCRLAPSITPTYSGPFSAWKLPNEAIAPPRTDREPSPTLIEVNPEQESIIGGARIWLKGMDVPVHVRLFARFGTAFVPKVSLLDLRWEP